MNDNRTVSQKPSPADDLAVLVSLSEKRAIQSNAPEGRIEQLQMLRRRIAFIRHFEKENAPKRVGVFGGPKRGKSTLINTLLGHELLPTSPIPLSSTTVEIECDPSVAGWKVTANLPNGRIDYKGLDSDRSAVILLENYGSRKGVERGIPLATRLRIKGAVEGCKILNQGGVLMDTPGAEISFPAETEEEIRLSDSEVQLKQESLRSLEALNQAHIVLFCTRADQIESFADSKFYSEKVRKLAPLLVVTMKDKWTTSSEELLDSAMKNYGVLESNVLLVSAHEAAEARRRETDPVPSGLPALEERILKELDRLSLQHGLMSCMEEFHRVVDEDPDLRPARVFFENLQSALLEGGDACAPALQAMIANSKFWKLQ